MGTQYLDRQRQGGGQHEDGTRGRRGRHICWDSGYIQIREGLPEAGGLVGSLQGAVRLPGRQALGFPKG